VDRDLPPYFTTWKSRGSENADEYKDFPRGTIECREVVEYFSTISCPHQTFCHLVTCSILREIIHRPVFYSRSISFKIIQKELIRIKISSKVGISKREKE